METSKKSTATATATATATNTRAPDNGAAEQELLKKMLFCAGKKIASAIGDPLPIDKILADNIDDLIAAAYIAARELSADGTEYDSAAALAYRAATLAIWAAYNSGRKHSRKEFAGNQDARDALIAAVAATANTANPEERAELMDALERAASTPRKRFIIGAVAAGFLQREIAARLGVSQPRIAKEIEIIRAEFLKNLR